MIKNLSHWANCLERKHKSFQWGLIWQKYMFFQTFYPNLQTFVHGLIPKIPDILQLWKRRRVGCRTMKAGRSCWVERERKHSLPAPMQQCWLVTAAYMSRQASTPHHQIGFGFVSDGICQSQEIYKYWDGNAIYTCIPNTENQDSPLQNKDDSGRTGDMNRAIKWSQW